MFPSTSRFVCVRAFRGSWLASRSKAAPLRSRRCRARRRPRPPLSEKVVYRLDRYAVVSTDDLALHAADLVFDTATEADQALRGLVATRPELTGALQVMPAAVVPTLEASY